VGITTANPGASLEVNGNVHVVTDLTFGGTLTGNGSGLTNVNSDSGSWVNGSSSNIHLAVSTDKVGIGVLDPSHKLDVDGDINISSGSTLRVGGTPAVFSNWTVHTNALDIYRSSGNVGIGVTSPDYPLDVQYNSDSGIRSKGTGSNHASVYIDAGSGYGYVRFQHSGTDKFWIQSTPTGDLAFRPNGSSHVFDINNSGYTRVSAGDSVSYVQTDHGGSIWRNYGSNLGAGIHFTGGAVIPADHNGGNHGGNTIDLGHTSYKWRNLYVNGQVNAGNLLSGSYTQSASYYITGAGTHFYNAGGLWGMRYNNPSYSWHRWNGPHHFDLYNNSSFTSGGVPFYINYYSGAQTRCYNFQNYSDDRIKTNERYITNATQTLLKLKPQIYDKGPNLGSTCSGTRVESGLIAQDVYYDTPELRHLVGYHDDAEIPDEKPYVDDDPQKDPDYSMWGSKSAAVDYIGLIAYLIKSNQEIYEDLQTTKTELLTTKTELKADLSETKADLQTTQTELTEERALHETTRTQLQDVLRKFEKLEMRTAYLESALIS
jgi:hypothetical protein